MEKVTSSEELVPKEIFIVYHFLQKFENDKSSEAVRHVEFSHEFLSKFPFVASIFFFTCKAQ